MTTSDEYFAGLFDGEGCVSMTLSKKGFISVQAKVSMCDRAPIEALYRRFGGYFDDGKQHTPNGREIYTWTAFNAAAVIALSVFADKCLVKCVAAKAALPIAQSMKTNKTRGVLSLGVKEARIAAAELIARTNKPVGPRRILDADAVAAYLTPKKLGGGKRVRLDDGREFSTVQEAAKAIGVSISAVSFAKRKHTKTAGFHVEYV